MKTSTRKSYPIRHSFTRCMMLPLFAWLIGNASVLADNGWRIETVTDSNWFTQMGQRCIAHTGSSVSIVYGGSHLKVASNSSGSWQTRVVDPSPGVGKHASIAAGPSPAYTPNITYYDEMNADLKFAWYQTGLPGGWRTETVDHIGEVGEYCSVAVDSSGYAHVVYHDETDNALNYAWKNASGWHLETVDRIPAGESGTCGIQTSITLDDNDRPHVGYHRTDAQSNIWYAHRGGGGTWTVEPVPVPAPGSAVLSSIAMDRYFDIPCIAYLSAISGQLYFIRRPASGWLGSATVPNARGRQSVSLQMDGITPTIVYRDRQTGVLKEAWLSDGTGEWELRTLDGNCQAAYISITEHEESPFVAYLDEATLELRCWHGPSGGQIETVDLAETVGGIEIALALDQQDRPHLIYSDEGRRDLVYAHHNGTSWDRFTVRSDIYFGNCALAISGSGHPHILYWDFDADQLTYAFRNRTLGIWQSEQIPGADSPGDLVLDAADSAHICYRASGQMTYAHRRGGTWHTETVAATDSGYGRSIALHPSGEVGIVYQDYSNDELIFAQRIEVLNSYVWSSLVVATRDFLRDSQLLYDPSGTPHVTYSYGAGVAEVACAWQEGGTWNTRVISSMSDPEYLSAAMSTAGTLHVAYQDWWPDFNLETVSFRSSAPFNLLPQIVDSPGRVGEHAALAMDQSDGVHIAYHDESSRNVKYAYKARRPDDVALTVISPRANASTLRWSGATREIDIYSSREPGTLSLRVAGPITGNSWTIPASADQRTYFLKFRDAPED